MGLKRKKPGGATALPLLLLGERGWETGGRAAGEGSLGSRRKPEPGARAGVRFSRAGPLSLPTGPGE